MAAIGNPNRFLNLINNLKIQYSRTLIFPDHYQYTKNDIPLNTNVLVTEKDYTKLKQFNHPNIWIVDVRAELDNSELISKIKSLIK